MAVRVDSMKKLFRQVWQNRSYSAPADRATPAAKSKYVPTTGTYPKGFLAGTAFAGVKASNKSHDDIALVVSEQPCPATAVFTHNIFKAAPVEISKKILESAQSLRGVVVNSGCANAVTGSIGREHAMAMARATDECFGANASTDGSPKTLVMSTGVIGQRLPIKKITEAIPKAHASLGSSHKHWMRAAQAICTTDTFPKLISRTFTLPSHPDTEYRMVGMTKGAGMIHPNMGTLLGMICTDVKIDQSSMGPFLRAAVNDSFNSISIDGDTSTNDTVAFFANGAAAPSNTKALQVSEDVTRMQRDTSEDGRAFELVLKDFAIDLAKLVVRDGEGATKFVTIRVRSDHSLRASRRAAHSIATSALVKTALYGKDANWGRILCAIGYAPGIMPQPSLSATKGLFHLEPQRVSVSFIPADGSEELRLLTRGEPEEIDEARAKVILEMEDLEIYVRLDDGPPALSGEDSAQQVGKKGEPSEQKVFEAVIWTCDFSHEYVTINGDYRT